MNIRAQQKVQPTQNATEFILRRLHSLVGLIPLTFFLIFHLTANSFALISPEKFNLVVDGLRAMPFLKFLEYGLLFIPFAFHGIYGMIISPHMTRASGGKYNKIRDFTYFMQRVTGILTMIFLVAHVWMFQVVKDLDYGVVESYLKQPIWFVFYTLGVSAAVYHMANGLWNFFISWGITVGPKAQKVSGMICLGLGLIIWVIGMLDLFAFAFDLKITIFEGGHH